MKLKLSQMRLKFSIMTKSISIAAELFYYLTQEEKIAMRTLNKILKSQSLVKLLILVKKLELY